MTIYAYAIELRIYGVPVYEKENPRMIFQPEKNGIISI